MRRNFIADILAGLVWGGCKRFVKHSPWSAGSAGFGSRTSGRGESWKISLVMARYYCHGLFEYQEVMVVPEDADDHRV
jgi:hypothetical protein